MNNDFPIIVVNLPERKDRRSQTEIALRRAGFPEAVFFPAIRPVDHLPFGSVGEKGCFLSHRAILESARGAKRIIVLEDDIEFNVAYSFIEERLAQLPPSWEFFYGGYLTGMPKTIQSPDSGVVQIGGNIELTGSHCYCINGPAISKVISALDVFSSRPRGHPEGGPMPIDGAFNVARGQLNLNTFALVPPAAYQRSSRSDVGKLKWFDRTPAVRQLASAARMIRHQMRRQPSSKGLG